MKHFVQISGLALLLCGVARAELPIALPTDDTTNTAHSIPIPAPLRSGGESSTNDITMPDLTQPDPRQQFIQQQYMPEWKLVPPVFVKTDAIVLSNGDELTGRFLGGDAMTLRWEHPAVAQPIAFGMGTNGVRALRLALPENGLPPVAAHWLVRLTNGSLLTGTALTLDAEMVELVTPLAGTLRLPRKLVAAVQYDSAAATKFQALQSPENWDRLQQPGNDAFNNSQYIAYRDLDLPDAVAVELVTPVGNTAHRPVQLFIFAKKDALYNEPSYNLTIANGQMVMINVMGRAGGHEMFQLPVAEQQTSMRLLIAINAATGEGALHCDGVLSRTFHFSPLPENHGRGICVISQMGRAGLPARLILSRITDDLRVAVPKPKQDSIRFANGDVVDGALEMIRTNGFVVTSNLGHLDLPLERFAGVTFTTPTIPLAGRREQDVAVNLRDGSLLIGALQELDDHSLTLESEALGRIKLTRAGIADLQMGSKTPPVPSMNRFANPYPPRSSANQEAGFLQLVSGERLAGQLLGFDDTAVRWNHPSASEPIVFRREAVQWAATTNYATAGSPHAMVAKFTNGDQISGEMLGLDEQGLQIRSATMTTPFTLARQFLSRLELGGHVTSLLLNKTQDPQRKILGLAGQGDITIDGKNVTFANGAYSIHHNALPDRLCFQFELSPGFTSVRAYAVNENNWGDGWQLSFNPNGTGLLVQMNTMNGQNAMANIQQPADGASVTWLLDRVRREAFLMISGQLVLHWKAVGESPKGANIGFNGGLRNFSLCEWKGKIEDLTNAVPAGAERLIYQDMMSLTAPVTGWQAGQFKLTGNTGTSTCPSDRVAWVDFRKADQQIARRKETDVRVHIFAGDQLTLDHARLDENGLTGASAGTGVVTIPLTALQRVDFQPYNPLPVSTSVNGVRLPRSTIIQQIGGVRVIRQM